MCYLLHTVNHVVANHSSFYKIHVKDVIWLIARDVVYKCFTNCGITVLSVSHCNFRI